MQKPRTDDRSLWDIHLGTLANYGVLVAHNLKLFSLLDDRPQTLTEVATQLQIHSRPAAALLTLSASVGLVQLKEGHYSLTPLAEDYFLERSPTYFGGFLDMVIAQDRVFSFDHVKKAVLTNSSQVYDSQKLFQSHEEQFALAKAFTQGMHGHSMAAALNWQNAIDLSSHKLLLDIGGGSGAHAIGAALHWSSLAAIVFDLPPVCEVAQKFITEHGVENQVTTQPGDMWNDPYPFADVHFYADIYHDWPPEKGRFLTQKSFDSLSSGGRILIHEMLYDDAKTGPTTTATYDMAMLLWTEGQQYSGQELSTLLSEVGFTAIESKPTFGNWSIVTGCKP
jgi:cyclopropane fatty-acyl-phospholipid synthase-like methyltransferase